MDLVTCVGLDSLVISLPSLRRRVLDAFRSCEGSRFGCWVVRTLVISPQLTFNWTRTGTTGPTDPGTNSGELNCPLRSCNPSPAHQGMVH